MTPTLADLTIDPPAPGPADWNDDGFLIVGDLIPDRLIEPYQRAWRDANGAAWPAGSPHGWPETTPYMRVPELLDICTYEPMQQIMAALVGEPVGVHLNLTGWVSTERDWHQDTYLNPPTVGDFYAAAWICLDDVDANSGPFELVPGSHRWPIVTRDKVMAALTPAERDAMWPKHSERLLTPLFEREIEEREADVWVHLPKRGDVLFWHGRTLHRGSRPRRPGAYRGALIAHYSGIHHRPDMPEAEQHGGGWYFPINGGAVR